MPTRATVACWHCVGTLVSPRALSSCRQYREALKADCALFFATWLLMLSRCRAVSELSALKGATYCIGPSRDRQDHVLYHLGGCKGVEAPVVHCCQVQPVLVLQGELPVRL